MQVGIQRGGLNPDKGLNTKKYLVAVFAFLIVALVGVLLWSSYMAHSAKPNINDHGKAGDGVTATEKGGTGR